MNPVVHFELPAEDRERMSDFYENIFGWQTQLLGPEMGEYVLVTTTETDENGMVKNPGAINGGFYKKSGEIPVKHPSVVVQVDVIEDAIKKIKKAGGEVLADPDEIPGVGMFTYFKDIEGNVVGILQPAPME